MQYVYTIKESCEWTCPATGKWKIICVGGGQSGGFVYSNAPSNLPCYKGIGGITTFGSYLATEVVPVEVAHASYTAATQGCNGYTMYPNTQVSLNALAAGVGYGAGGSCVKSNLYYYKDGATAKTTAAFNGVPGLAGDIAMTIIDIDEGTQIPCTIGSGGTITDSLNADTIVTYLQTCLACDVALADFDTVADEFYCCAKNGVDGVIILEYLGV